MRSLPRADADLVFELASVGTQLREAGRDDDGGSHALRDTLAYQAGHGGGRRGDHGQLDRLRLGHQARLTVDVLDRTPPWG